VTMTHDLSTAQGKAESILDVPAELMTKEDRARYYARANAGEDVYCYTAVKAPEQPDRWNLWDTDTRIPLVPVASAFELVFVTLARGQFHTWTIEWRGPEQSTLEHITIGVGQPFEEPDVVYAARVRRIALCKLAEAAQMQVTPHVFEGFIF
jgi:hypothetical protein